MKHRLIAMTAAFLLSLTPMTAHASSVIVVEPEEPANLEDYTTSYDAIQEAGGITFSDNQVLLYWELPVMREGCVVTPNTMEWEISGTADVTYKTGNLGKDVSYEEIYAGSYCLITANSPGSVHVVGTEYSLYDSDGTEFYFNLTVGEDGNFNETVDMDNPIEPIISEDSVYFPKPDLPCEFSLLVSSNLESTAVHDNDGYTFTPEEDGWYVVSTRSYCEEIVSYGESGHFHYFYPMLHNYVVIADDKGIRVNHWGDKSWYSEEQVSEAIAEAGNDENIACYSVYAAQPDDVMHGAYFSFINGQLPTVQGDYDSYITNVYTEYGTDSYFCVNHFYSDIVPNEPRVQALEKEIVNLTTQFTTASTCNGDLTACSPDMMQLARIYADETLEGDLTVVVDGKEEYLLTVENGIFHHRKAPKLMGDCNGDGIFSVTDIVMLQKYLLSTGNLNAPQNADLCEDGSIDAFDLAVMKRELLRRNQNAEPMLVVVDEQIYEIDGWTSKTFVEVLDSEGFWHVQESDRNSWELDIAECLSAAPAMIGNVTPSDRLTDAERAETQTFLENAAQYEETEMTAWDFGIEDYGQENLYALYPDGNGGYHAVELCRFGGECAWLDNADVQAFVTMLIENGYYADEMFFHEFLEWYT
ncbi:MAG: dockerin type I repeat-containing protein [Oscillospiraceae bacterium]|nr:dockerin type I repeat-containing protein [Oscillospiraceae bacterium]